MNTDSPPTLGNGKICYLEIPSRNIEESAAFYTNVFGWHVRTRSDGSTAFDDGVMEVSGTWRTDRTASTTVGMLLHIMVADIHKTMKLVEDNGGKIIQGIGGDLPEITARFTDPSGNIFSIFEQEGLK